MGMVSYSDSCQTSNPVCVLKANLSVPFGLGLDQDLDFLATHLGFAFDLQSG